MEFRRKELSVNFHAPHIQVLQSEPSTRHPESFLKNEIKGESSHTDTRGYTVAGAGGKVVGAGGSITQGQRCKDWVLPKHEDKSVNENE